MSKYREGMIVETKSRDAKSKVLGVCGLVVFISNPDEFEKSGDGLTEQEMDKYFTIFSEPKEDWTPKDGDCYYHISSRGTLVQRRWKNGDPEHLGRKEYQGIFKTYIEAEAQLEKIKKLLAEGK